MTSKTFPISNVAERKSFVEAMIETAVMKLQRIDETNWTIGIMKFADGWSVQGKAVCVSDADYDTDIAMNICWESCTTEANTHYWRTVGYLAMIGMTEITVPYFAEPEINQAYEQ